MKNYKNKKVSFDYRYYTAKDELKRAVTTTIGGMKNGDL